MPMPAEIKLEALRRELRYRRKVYPRRVAEGRMSDSFAAVQIAIFEEIIQDYEILAQQERLL
jgi:hypothetical protein